MYQTSQRISEPLRLRVWGERACFTRPEMKVERVSYDVMTPSAARGVLEAVLWKPQMQWILERIDVLKPIRKASVRRNEVGQKASVDNLMAAMAGRSARLGIDIEEARQQRAAVILRDVDLPYSRPDRVDRAGWPGRSRRKIRRDVPPAGGCRAMLPPPLSGHSGVCR